MAIDLSQMLWTSSEHFKGHLSFCSLAHNILTYLLVPSWLSIIVYKTQPDL